MAKKESKKAKTNKINLSIRFIIIAFLLVIISFLFWESASLLLIGMLPTAVAWMIDRSKQKSKTLTVGAMNFAGCFPYLMGVWTAFDPAVVSARYLGDPLTIIMIYGAAFVGYVINYVSVAAFSSYAAQRAKDKISKIDKEKKALEKRWGKKVNGQTPLDSKGFPTRKGVVEEEENLDREAEIKDQDPSGKAPA